MKSSKTAFDSLVSEVKENKLSPQEELTTIERQIDEYIKEAQLAYVHIRGFDGKNCGAFYIYYKPTGEWLALSWHKLRKELPVLHMQADRYLSLERTVMTRLKMANRVYKTVRLVDVRFE